MEFTAKEKRFLSHLGRTENGRDLIAVLNRAKNFYSQIDDIDGAKGDYGAQVEGRKLFKSFVKKITDAIETKEHIDKVQDVDDYD